MAWSREAGWSQTLFLSCKHLTRAIGQVPQEVLENLAHQLDAMSLLHFASTDTWMRQAAQKAAVMRLHKLGKDFPDLAICLARIGWTKEHALALPIFDCSPFLLLIGPWLSWNNLKLHIKERAPVLSGSLWPSVESLITFVSKNKIFAISRSIRESTLTAVDRDNVKIVKESQIKVVAKITETPYSSLQATNFEETLVVRSCVPRPGYRKGAYTLSIYNSDTLAKVSEIDLALEKVSSEIKKSDSFTNSSKSCSELNLNDETVLQKLEIGDVVMAKNTIVVHLMFRTDDDFSSETWIWSLDTKNPVMEDLTLERVFMEPLSQHGESPVCSIEDEVDLGLLAVNSRFLVRVGQVDDSSILQHFSRCHTTHPPCPRDDGQGMPILDLEGTIYPIEVKTFNPVQLMGKLNPGTSRLRIQPSEGEGG